jgi:hypothetical protein
MTASVCVGTEFVVGSLGELQLKSIQRNKPWPYICDPNAQNWLRVDSTKGLWAPPRTNLTISEHLSASPGTSVANGATSTITAAAPVLNLVNPNPCAVMSIFAAWHVHVTLSLPVNSGAYVNAYCNVGTVVPGTVPIAASFAPITAGTFTWNVDFTMSVWGDIPAGGTKTVNRALSVTCFNAGPLTITNWATDLDGHAITSYDN